MSNLRLKPIFGEPVEIFLYETNGSIGIYDSARKVSRILNTSTDISNIVDRNTKAGNPKSTLSKKLGLRIYAKTSTP